MECIPSAHQNILIRIKCEKECTENGQIDTKVYEKLLNRQKTEIGIYQGFFKY